jgi:hypothetical protein
MRIMRWKDHRSPTTEHAFILRENEYQTQTPGQHRVKARYAVAILCQDEILYSMKSWTTQLVMESLALLKYGMYPPYTAPLQMPVRDPWSGAEP